MRVSLLRRCGLLLAPLASMVPAVPASLANGLGENVAWQFQTTGDRANRAFVEEMRQKKMSGAYSPPVYNTFIDKQFNCNVSSIATGNESSTNAVGNSPTTSGNSASAAGNTNSSNAELGAGGASVEIDDSLVNEGKVRARAKGEIESEVHGDTSQVLNTDQVNSGNQSASIASSNACQFGPLN